MKITIPKLKTLVKIFFSAPLQRLVWQHQVVLPIVLDGVHVAWTNKSRLIVLDPLDPIAVF
jgi:hypothetical protein